MSNLDLAIISAVCLAGCVCCFVLCHLDRRATERGMDKFWEALGGKPGAKTDQPKAPWHPGGRM